MEPSVKLQQLIVSMTDHKSSVELEVEPLVAFRLWVRQPKCMRNHGADVAKESRRTLVNIWSRVRQLKRDGEP